MFDGSGAGTGAASGPRNGLYALLVNLMQKVLSYDKVLLVS